MKDVKCTRGVYIHRSKDNRIALEQVEMDGCREENRIIKMDSSFRFCFPWQPSSVIPVLHCLSPLTKRAGLSQPLLRRDCDWLAQTNLSDLQMNVSLNSFPFLLFVFQNYGSLNLSKFTNFIGDDWDIYAMTGLALLFGILLLLRRRQ